jgi:type I restriction enzyme S subunit
MNKQNTLHPNTDATTTLVPKLRFPEFRDAEGWDEIQLQKIARPVTDKAVTGDVDNILSLSGEHGLVLQSDYFGKKIAGESSERYIKLRRDDFVYNDRTTKASTYGTIKRLSKYAAGIVSPIYKCFRFNMNENPTFWEWYFESGRHDNALGSLVNEGARAGRFNISVSQFLSTNAWRPEEPEQQRIADCLSSLDALIAAQARKVDALKTHKKGLMQQLFPRAGETQPRLRFPEFQDAGEWECNSIGGIFETSSGGTPDRSKVEYWNGTIPWITTSLVDFNVITKSEAFISDSGLKNSSAKIFPKNTILIAMYGQGKTRGQVAMLGLPAATNQACAALLPKEGFFPDFVFLNIGSRYDELRSLSNSGGQENLSQGLIQGLLFSYPSLPEQQRIADCLSSLDAVINAATQRLAALKTHKQGLMQQLFPSMDEVAS